MSRPVPKASGAAGADLVARVAREIADRRDSLRSALEEYEDLLGALQALEAEQRRAERAANGRVAKPSAERAGRALPKRGRSSSSSARSPSAEADGDAPRAILAALEHGSHTVAELVVVTALSPSEIRDAARGLVAAGKAQRTRREGKAAYALLS